MKIESFTELKAAFTAVCKSAINETLSEGYIRAIEMSLGDLTYAELAAEDYPYAKRHGHPLEPPEIINIHSGDFMESWWQDKATSQKPFSGALINDSNVADFLNEGTDVMFERPIEKVVAEYMEKILEEELTKRLSRLGKGKS